MVGLKAAALGDSQVYLVRLGMNFGFGDGLDLEERMLDFIGREAGAEVTRQGEGLAGPVLTGEEAAGERNAGKNTEVVQLTGRKGQGLRPAF